MTTSSSLSQKSAPMTVVAKRAITLVAITGFVVVFGIGDYWLGFEKWQIHYWADGAGIIVALFSGLKCLQTANSTSGHDRTAWHFFGLACLIWFAGMLIWSYYEIVERVITPFPALSDVCFLASPAFFIVGGFYYKSGHPQAGVALKHAYDLGIVFCATLIATTIILFEPIQASTETWQYISASVAYAVFYISAFLFALFWLWMRLWGEKRRIYMLIILGLGVLAFVHTLYALALLGKTYESGHYTDIFWIIGFAIIYWAAFEGRYVPGRETHASASIQLDEQEKPSGALISGVSVLSLLTTGFLFRDNLNDRVLVYLFPVGVVFGVLLSLREWWVYKIERALREKTIAISATQRDSEASLLNAQRIAKLGNWDWNIATGELHWSDQIYRIFGLEPQQFGATYEAFLQSVHPEDRGAVQAAVERALEKREPYALDHRIVLPDGEERIVHEQAEVVFDEAGTPLRMTGTVQDVTERKRAESALRDSEERFRVAFEQAGVGMALLTLDGRWTRVNQQLCNMLGYSREEMLERRFHDVTHSDDLDATLRNTERALAGEVPAFTMKKRYLRKDGSIVWGNLTAALVRDALGKPNHFVTVLEDITEKMRAEQKVRDLNENLERRVEERTAELRESEERLDLAIQSASFGTWSRNIPGDTLIWDKRTEAIYGLEPGTFEGTMEAFLDRVHPDDREMIITGHRHAVEDSVSYAIDFRIVWPNGEVRHIASRASVVRGGRDSSLQLIGMVHDITERKRAEEALRESEGRLALAAQLANFGTWSRSVPSDEVIWDERTEAIYGLEPGTFEGTMEAVLAQVHPDDRERIKTRQRRLLEEGLPYSVEFRILLPNGETRHVGSWASVVGGDRDSSQLIIGITHDITERKRAEEALRDSEEQLRLITDNVPAAIAYISENQRYRFINKHYEEWFGITSEEAQGRFIGDVLGEATHNAIKDKLALALSGELVAFETKVQTTDAGIRDVQPTYVPHFTDDGAVKGVFVLVTDITERKRLESEVLRQERLATLGQLTATVSHELRNPLGVIRTSAFTLRNDIDLDAPRAVRALERVERSVIRCDRIIDELLDFTRISGLDPQPTVLDDWLDGVLEEQELPAGVVLRRDFGLPAKAVSFDPDRLRRAVINVFDNACQAMLGEHAAEEAPGERVLTVRTKAHDGRIEVIFEDRGPGIPVEIYERIFEPLFSTKGFGVGLGLPVVKQIMERHGGGIEVESEQGRGTTVRLWLDPEANRLDANHKGATA